VTKALDAETEAKTESGGFETEAEAQGSWTILFAVQSSVTTIPVCKFYTVVLKK